MTLRSGILKGLLFLTILGLEGCKDLADPPAVDQCQFNGTPLSFFCINTVSKAKEKRPLTDPRMKAAQCLSADDYRAMMAYEDYLIQQAEVRCK